MRFNSFKGIFANILKLELYLECAQAAVNLFLFIFVNGISLYIYNVLYLDDL